MACVCVKLIERAGRAADDEKVEQKIAESWEELGLVSASPPLIQKGIEGVVVNHVAETTKQQKGTGDNPSSSHFMLHLFISHTLVLIISFSLIS